VVTLPLLFLCGGLVIPETGVLYVVVLSVETPSRQVAGNAKSDRLLQLGLSLQLAITNSHV